MTYSLLLDHEASLDQFVLKSKLLRTQYPHTHILSFDSLSRDPTREL